MCYVIIFWFPSLSVRTFVSNFGNHYLSSPKFSSGNNRSQCTCHRLPRGGGDLELYVGELGTLWELCNKCELLWWGKCGDIDLWCPKPSEKMWGLCVWQSEERLEPRYVFTRSMKRFEKDLRVRMRRCLLTSISYFFFLHEIDHLSNISMHRTVEQLAEKSGEYIMLNDFYQKSQRAMSPTLCLT